ncbi:hypothetical protein [Amycolatopsis circi]|uniref:hypothetical protein n=1 Tax=Amycolatopsis circi TaxID=871959 RepID=UPI000E27E657|nr:hypothetical protein [Amycolatopsis circi]
MGGTTLIVLAIYRAHRIRHGLGAVASGTTLIIALAVLATTARARAGAERVARRFADQPITEPV